MSQNVLAGLALVGAAVVALPSSAHAFECADLDPGLGLPPGICAPALVIGFTVPNLLKTVTPGDAPLILRTTAFPTTVASAVCGRACTSSTRSRPARPSATLSAPRPSTG